MRMYGYGLSWVVVILSLGMMACQTRETGGNTIEPPSPEWSSSLPQQTAALERITPTSLLTELSNIHPSDGSEVCPRPEIGMNIRLNDAMRRDGVFDTATVMFTLDGSDLTKRIDVAGSQSFPQTIAGLSYVPSVPLSLGLHRASLTFPTVAGVKSFAWTFMVTNIPCTQISAVTPTPNPEERAIEPSQAVPGEPRPANLPPEILSFRPLSGSHVCSRPQIALGIRLNDAMRRDGVFDLATVTLTFDGNDVTQKASVSGSLTYPQSQALLIYIPPSALSVGAHQVTFTFPAAVGRKSFTWTFNVSELPCS